MRAILLLVIFSNVTLAEEYYPPLIHIKPTYPKQALENCIEGFVVLSYILSKDHEALDIKVVRSEPKGVFDEAALKNFKRSLPSFIKDSKVGKRTEKTFNFNIEGGCEKNQS